MLKQIGLLLSGLCLSVAGAFGETSIEKNIYNYHLKNGLQIIVKPDHRAPIAVIQIWYKVGSSYEPNGITGISHALEHLMFDGSTNYPGNVYAKTISQNGGEENAATTYDYTYYYTNIAADRLPLVFRLEADRMQNLKLTEKVFTKEMQVVHEELRLRFENNPQARTFERFMAAAYLSIPYHHPVIGWSSDLENMTVRDVRSWYESWYAPNNAAVVVAGDVEPQAVFDLAEKTFGSIPAHELPVLKPHREQTALGERKLSVKLPAKLPWLLMGYLVPSLKTIAKDHEWEIYALMVADGILNGDDSARLTKNLVRGKEIASSISTGFNPLERFDSQFLIEATPTQKQSIKNLKLAILEEIKKLQTTLPTQNELQRIKTEVIAANIYAKDSIAAQASQLGELASLDLPLNLTEDLPKQIEKVTAQQVQAVAKKYFLCKHLTTATLKPLPLNPQQLQQLNTQSQPLGTSNVH